MRKLTLRLLTLILSVYVAGSIYPLLAHEPCPTHAPAPTRPAVPPAAPPTKPASPAGVDAKTPPLRPPPSVAPGEGGCGPEGLKPLIQADQELEDWKKEDFDFMAQQKIDQVKNQAKIVISDIRLVDIKKAQDRWHQADIEVHKYQIKKNQGTLIDPDLLEMAQEERQEAWAELQRQKAKIKKVEDWRSKRVSEISAFRDRAKSGEYSGYLGLKNVQTGVPSSLLK
jgi:hypothetical protein